MAAMNKLKPFESQPSTAMNMGVKWKKNYLIVIGLFCVVAIIYISGRSKEVWSSMNTSDSSHYLNFPSWRNHKKPGTYDIWKEFQSYPELQQTYFSKRCALQDDFSIAGIIKVHQEWERSRDSVCRDLLMKFNAMFTLEARFATVKVPEPFTSKVKRWLGNDERLYKEVFNQSVINILNHVTHEHTVFNPIRDKRPVIQPDVPENVYVEKILESTSKTCDFCNYKKFTAEHDFGRVESEFAFSASNIFKLAPYHAIIAPKTHNPLTLTLEQFLDVMRLTKTWIAKANKHHPEARFPAMIWDVLPKCAASQVHPHIQAVLDQRRYHGQVEVWREGAQDYFGQFGTNYYSDLVTMYAALNLTARYGNAVAFANLVPKKDHEVVIMADSPSDDFFSLIYMVTRAFLDDLGKNCYSMGIGYPAVGVPEGKIPAYARIITRGVVSEVRADISSFELFLATNVNIDPYKTIGYVRKSISKRRP